MKSAEKNFIFHRRNSAEVNSYFKRTLDIGLALVKDHPRKFHAFREMHLEVWFLQISGREQEARSDFGQCLTRRLVNSILIQVNALLRIFSFEKDFDLRIDV